MDNNKFPLNYELSKIPPEASFGFKRKFDVHTGIDLYCAHQEPVYAIEDGLIMKIDWFTGEKAGSQWWNDTQYLGVLGKSGYIIYGEISIDGQLKVGDKISKGQLCGLVETVLKKDKGRPMNMLHLELYTEFIDDPLVWKIDELKDSRLEDPIKLFQINSSHKHK